MAASIPHHVSPVNLPDFDDAERAPYSRADLEWYRAQLADSGEVGHDVHGECPYSAYECPNDSAGDAMDDDGPADDPWFPGLRRDERLHRGVPGMDDSDSGYYGRDLDRPRCVVKTGGTDYVQVLLAGELVGIIEFDEDDPDGEEEALRDAELLAWRIDHTGR